MITRNFYISLLVFNCILFVGGWLLRDSEAGVQAVVVAAFAIGLTLLHVLDDRDRRRKQSGDLLMPDPPLPIEPAPPPPGVPLDETAAPIHFEGDTKSV